MPTPFTHALTLIDSAHASDPRIHTTLTGTTIPYELHYAEKCTSYLAQRCAAPSEALQLAVRAQHLRRWEVPRSSYPDGKLGYLRWRADLKRRQAEMVEGMCREAGVEEGVVGRVGRLVRKEGLGRQRKKTTKINDEDGNGNGDGDEHVGEAQGKESRDGNGNVGHGDGAEEEEEQDEEVAVLEDVACLVFLDDQFEGWERESGLNEEKILGILRKTWAKMSPKGRDMALGMVGKLGERPRELIGKALTA